MTSRESWLGGEKKSRSDNFRVFFSFVREELLLISAIIQFYDLRFSIKRRLCLHLIYFHCLRKHKSRVVALGNITHFRGFIPPRLPTPMCLHIFDRNWFWFRTTVASYRYLKVGNLKSFPGKTDPDFELKYFGKVLPPLKTYLIFFFDSSSKDFSLCTSNVLLLLYIIVPYFLCTYCLALHCFAFVHSALLL